MIDKQIIMEDEWHGLLTLVKHDATYLLSHFGENDYCIPLTLIHKVLAETVGLDEVWVRVIPLCFGCATIIVIPAIVRANVSVWAGALSAWLIAISPLMVYFSRLSRPYAIGVLTAWISAWAIQEWAKRQELRHASVFVLSSALCVWFLPVFAPFLTGLWLAKLTSRKALVLGFVTFMIGGALLAPALVCDLSPLTGKVGRASVRATTLDGVVSLFAGVWPRTLAGPIIMMALLGVAKLLRRGNSFVSMLVIASAMQVTCVSLSHASGINGPIIMARYCLPVLPLLITGVATMCSEWVLTKQWLGRVLVTCGVVGMVALGPWWDTYWFPNQLTAHYIYQSDYEAERDPLEMRLMPARVSKAYEMLAALERGTVTVVEVPFPQESTMNPYAVLQRFHRQFMIGGTTGSLVPNALTGIELGAGKRNPRFIVDAASSGDVIAKGADYVIVHKNLNLEFPNAVFGQPTEVGPVIVSLEAAFGRPVFEDGDVKVYGVSSRARQKPERAR